MWKVSVAYEKDRSTLKAPARPEAMVCMHSGVHGQVCDLGKVTQQAYSLPLSVVMGKEMKAIVVDNDQVAKQCITHLNQRRWASEQTSLGVWAPALVAPLFPLRPQRIQGVVCGGLKCTVLWGFDGCGWSQLESRHHFCAFLSQHPNQQRASCSFVVMTNAMKSAFLCRLPPMTFLPLASVKCSEPSERLRQLGGTARLAVDLVEFDDRFKRAFYSACG